jgi:hypothetical protein
MNSNDPSMFLRVSLRANATFSAISGSVFTFAGAGLAEFLGVAPAELVISVGINLLGFAAALLWVSMRAEIPLVWARIIIGLDVAWVVGTAVAVFAGVFSSEGATAAVAVANLVLAFAVLQWIGVRRVVRADAPA